MDIQIVFFRRTTGMSLPVAVMQGINPIQNTADFRPKRRLAHYIVRSQYRKMLLACRLTNPKNIEDICMQPKGIINSITLNLINEFRPHTELVTWLLTCQTQIHV